MTLVTTFKISCLRLAIKWPKVKQRFPFKMNALRCEALLLTAQTSPNKMPQGMFRIDRTPPRLKSRRVGDKEKKVVHQHRRRKHRFRRFVRILLGATAVIGLFFVFLYFHRAPAASGPVVSGDDSSSVQFK